MEPEKSGDLIKWSSEKFSDILFVDYEQLNMDDSFGKVMIANLKVGSLILQRIPRLF